MIIEIPINQNLQDYYVLNNIYFNQTIRHFIWELDINLPIRYLYLVRIHISQPCLIIPVTVEWHEYESTAAAPRAGSVPIRQLSGLI